MTPTADGGERGSGGAGGGGEWRGRPTFSGRGQRRRGRLGVAEEHLLVQAAQGVVGGVGVLLDKDVAGRHDVDHDHLHRHAAGEEQLPGGSTGETGSRRTPGGRRLTQEVMGSEGSVRGGGGGA